MTFVKRPWVSGSEELGDRMHRLDLRATFARGSEWLAEGHFATAQGARAHGVIMHGPRGVRG